MKIIAVVERPEVHDALRNEVEEGRADADPRAEGDDQPDLADRAEGEEAAGERGGERAERDDQGGHGDGHDETEYHVAASLGQGPGRRACYDPPTTVIPTGAAVPDQDPTIPSEFEVAARAAAAGYRFGDIEVPATIARAIAEMGFVTPTEVQAGAIPPLRRGEDLIGQAQTGTGKTAAFGIPIVEKIDPSTSSTSRPSS